MADNVEFQSATPATPAAGTKVATDDDGTSQHQYVKVEFGGDGTFTKVSTSDPLPTVDSAAGTILAAIQTAVEAIQTAAEIIDNIVSGNEAQVDVLTMPTVTVDSELTTADLDTGGGTDTRAVVGLVGSASGGGALIPGSATDGLLVNLGSNNDVTVTGTVTANLAAGTNNIGDVDILSIAAGNNNIGDVDIASIAAGDNNIGNVDVVTLPSLPAGTNNIGDVDVLTVPADPFGATADAAVSAGATGSISAKLRSISRDLVANIVLAAGTNAIGKLAANSGVDIGDVDVTSISAGTNLIGDVGIQPRATNGLTTMNATSSDGATALTNSAQVIKATAGKLYGYYIYNPNTAAAFVQFYNTAAASVTVGTTNPLFMITIPAGSAANVLNDIGIGFSNAGWSWAATSTAGGNGALTTALDAVAWYA